MVAEKIEEKISDYIEKKSKKVAKKLVKKMAKKMIKKVIKKCIKKGLIKSAGKKIPGVSLVMGFGSGIWEFCKGNFTKGSLEIASGAAGTVPGAGTAGSMAIDSAILVMDICEHLSEGNLSKKDMKKFYKKGKKIAKKW